MRSHYQLKGKKVITIAPRGDVHLGSEDYNEEYFQFSLDNIKTLSNPIVYWTGDMVEAASKQIGNSSYRVTMSLDDQLDQINTYIQPFKKYSRFYCIGNHETRLLKEFDINIARIIAQNLDIPFGHQYIDKFTVNGEPYRVYIAHGRGSSAHFYTAQSKILRDTQHIDADMYLNGHNHRCGYFSMPIRTDTGIRRKHYMFTGAYLSYQDSYADMMQLPILPEAFGNLTVNKDRRVRANLFYIDECRPDLLKL